MHPASEAALLAAAGFVASAVNAVAGGGSLVSFPVLLALGHPALVANVTNSVALLPGYATSSGVSRSLLAAQRARILALAPAAVVGALTGAVLVTRTPASTFRLVVPWLILIACSLLALQPRLAALVRPSGHGGARLVPLLVLQFLSGVYGGFFGAGLGVLLLAVLGLLLVGTLHQLNALKQLLSLLIALAAAAWFVAFGPVAWSAAAFVAVGSVAGGAAGVLVARRLRADVLRIAVVLFGVAIAVRLLV
jgi:uncharacterized membrane protein YfcA